MKLQILSDIHLEFCMHEFDFSECDVLILAGDIHLGIKGIEWIPEKVKDKPVIRLLLPPTWKILSLILNPICGFMVIFIQVPITLLAKQELSVTRMDTPKKM